MSGAQYEILMLVSRAPGLLAVGEVAARLHRSGAFITIEANKLVAHGILEKVADPADGRRVLLRANEKSGELLDRLAPFQRRVNDVLFERLDARRLCLRFHETTTHRMHSDPVRLLIERRKQPDNFVFILLPEKVKAPSTVFTAAP